MDLTAFLAAMRLIGRELHARTVNDHNPLVRFARQPGGIVYHPIAGFVPANA